MQFLCVQLFTCHFRAFQLIGVRQTTPQWSVRYFAVTGARGVSHSVTLVLEFFSMALRGTQRGNGAEMLHTRCQGLLG